jgi:hypothetical protein
MCLVHGFPSTTHARRRVAAATAAPADDQHSPPPAPIPNSPLNLDRIGPGKY